MLILQSIITMNKRILGFSLAFLVGTLVFANSTYAAVTISKTMTTDVKLFNTSSFVGTGSAQTFKCFAGAGYSSGDCFISRGDFYKSLYVGNGDPKTQEVTVILQKGYVYNITARVSTDSSIGDKVTAYISD